jgi:DNA polymerase III alpha subunit
MEAAVFVPLRVHSVFSRGRGAATPAETAAWAAENNLPAAALSDIGSLHGWAKWKRAAEAAGVKPLFGSELPLAGPEESGGKRTAAAACFSSSGAARATQTWSRPSTGAVSARERG